LNKKLDQVFKSMTENGEHITRLLKELKSKKEREEREKAEERE